MFEVTDMFERAQGMHILKHHTVPMNTYQLYISMYQVKNKFKVKK